MANGRYDILALRVGELLDTLLKNHPAVCGIVSKSQLAIMALN